MKKKILKTISQHNLIKENMHIVLGLSGGPDSMCLFDVLLDIAEKMNLSIHPVHVNHKFRPGAAEEDQKFVEKLCASKGLKCRTFVIDCNEMAVALKLTSEEAGRKARYDSFFSVAEEIAADGIGREDIVVAVAQNANDQCETILFRILRGTGTDGLSGIAYKRLGDGGFEVIRPLLDVTREEIENYCEARNLQPRIDHTNNESVYTRNKIRLELIPLLAEKFNGNIIETVNRLGKIAAQDKDFIWQEAQKVFDKALCRESEYGEEVFCRRCSIFTEPLSDVHKAVRLRVYNLALSKAGMYEDITEAYLEAIDKVCLSAKPSASTDLADGFKVTKAYDRLVFYKDNMCADINGWIMKTFSAEEFSIYAAQSAEKGRLYGAFSGDKIGDSSRLEVRTRKDGDYISIGSGRKKLQDFFVDCKVPKMYRDIIPVLALGNNVLWIMPSEHFPDKTYREKGRFGTGLRADFEHDSTIIVLEQM